MRKPHPDSTGAGISAGIAVVPASRPVVPSSEAMMGINAILILVYSVGFDRILFSTG
jgi:hypothetical protein